MSEEQHEDYTIDVTPIRRTIAERTRRSLSEVPHAFMMMEADVTNLVRLRHAAKERFLQQEGVALTYLPFLVNAVVCAIKEHPLMNSIYVNDKIMVKKDVNLSLLVGTEHAVWAPVLKQADRLSIAGLAIEIDKVTRKAREGRLKLEDLQGGTFTVNNTGSFGSISSYPTVNQPQAAILTFESIVNKPVVLDEMIAVRSMVHLCLSLDHRILNGTVCGSFLQSVRGNLENIQLNTQLY
ncbi:hypothetical protein CF651_24550 [Paenibacillus rigui]|uniref:2-oxoacid dehydrogenase acyltransferase catalytic domain-containing protein n=1 Tax=Paenibacillus rigui TaxID=554312 RepID=A0A229UJW1_9BACL|nr:hypothetical protein CF651_24550 [Paenibacillus rigui]